MRDEHTQTSAVGAQFTFVFSVLGNATVSHHHNNVCVLQKLELVGGHHHRSAFQFADNHFIENVLSNVRIDSGQRIIEQNNWLVTINSSSNGNTLFLFVYLRIKII